MAPAERLWPDDYRAGPDVTEEGAERLCESCFEIRKRPSKLRKLSKWAEDTNVIWFKITLDYKCLMDALKGLYCAYLRQGGSRAGEEDAKVRFSLVYEFLQDYDGFLNKMNKELAATIGEESLEDIMKDLYCIRSDSPVNIFKPLKIFNECMNEFFPEFKKLSECPIKIGIAHCGAKFPFFEIWRELIKKHDLQIILIGRGIIRTSIKYIDQLLIAKEGNYKKSALHKLAEIAKLSEKLAELKFADRSEKEDFGNYEILKRHLLPMGLDFHGILTFARLIED